MEENNNKEEIKEKVENENNNENNQNQTNQDENNQEEKNQTEEVKKQGFFKKVWYSITKIERYPEMAAQGLGKAFSYICKVVAIKHIKYYKKE